MEYEVASPTHLTLTRHDSRDSHPMEHPVALARTRAFAPTGVSPACSACRLKECLPRGLGERLQELNQLVLGRRRVRKGDSLYVQGAPLDSLHVVRLGCFKTTMTFSDGSEHVTEFSFAGDVMGFDALAAGVHGATATALEDGEACTLSYDALLTLPSGTRGGLRRRIYQMFGAKLTRDQWLMALIARANSEPRVAAFLLLMSHRMRERGFSSTEFNLVMSRAEIGSYLGLSVESVSRALSSFAHRGLVEVRHRRLRLLAPEAIAGVSEAALPGICQGFSNWELRRPM